MTTLPPPVIEDEDDLEVRVQPGTKCLRLGCGKPFVSEEASRLGDGEDATCVYHPSTVRRLDPRPCFLRDIKRILANIPRRQQGMQLQLMEY